MANSDIFNEQMASFYSPSALPTAHDYGSGSFDDPNQYGWWNDITGHGAELATQNRFQAQQAAMANQFSHDEAALNRDWQERMSNTQYQRAMADMKAAGINPLNMGGIDGASVATTAAAQAHQGAPNAGGPDGFGSFLKGLISAVASIFATGAKSAIDVGKIGTMAKIADDKLDFAKNVQADKNAAFKIIRHAGAKHGVYVKY